MSQEGLAAFLRDVNQKPSVQRQLASLGCVEAANLAHHLGYDVCCGDLLRYESRAFAWQLSDAEYELIARLQHPRRHWWQRCFGTPGQGEEHRTTEES
jgi:hypothetical protein